MVSESCDDVEGEILHRLRRMLGDRRIPICGVVDLHANFTRRMAENADALIAYRENPHIDAKTAAGRAVGLLDRLMETGRRCTTLWQHPPILWPPTGTGTNADPMRSLEAEAREIERRHDDILAVNVLAGFAFADVPDAGVSFTAVTLGDPEVAQSELARLAALAERLEGTWQRQRHAGGRGHATAGDPSQRARDLGGTLGQHRRRRRRATARGLLRALLEHNVEKAVVVINDPEAVASLAAASIGSHAATQHRRKGKPPGRRTARSRRGTRLAERRPLFVGGSAQPSCLDGRHAASTWAPVRSSAAGECSSC